MHNSSALTKLLFFITMLSSIFSCSRSSKIYDRSFTHFPIDKTLKIEKDSLFSVPKHIKPGRIFIGNDFLIIRNDKIKSDSLFFQYALNGQFQKKYIKLGTDYGNAYAAMSSGILNNKVWFHDLALSKVVIIDPKSDSNSRLEYKLKNFAYSTQLMSEKTLLASGFYHSQYLLESFNLSDEKIIVQIGQFTPPNKTIPFNNWKAAYESFLFLRPGKDKALLAGRYSDNIEIFDLSKNTKISISGPDNFDPEFDPAKDSLSNDYKISFNNESRIATTGGFVTEKYIYLLYAGKKFLNEDWMGYSNIIHVFDWEGNPVMRLKLDKMVKSIAVSKDDKVLYTVQGTTGIITKTINFL